MAYCCNPAHWSCDDLAFLRTNLWLVDLRSSIKGSSVMSDSVSSVSENSLAALAVRNAAHSKGA